MSSEKPEETESSQTAESSSPEAPVASEDAPSATSPGPEPTKSPPPTSPASLVGIDLDTIGRGVVVNHIRLREADLLSS